MRPSHVCEALHHLVRIRQPVFLWGPPGVGKSRLVADVARRQGRKLYDLRAVLLDPVDLRGLPRISDKGITSWCVPEFLPHPQDTEEGILFLDELNAAPLWYRPPATSSSSTGAWASTACPTAGPWWPRATARATGP